MTAVTLNGEDVLWKLNRLYSIWDISKDKTDSSWHEVDVIFIITGKSATDDFSADELQNDSVLFQLWLTGFQFPETLMVLTRDRKFFVLSSSKKISHLEQIKNCHPGIVLLVRDPADDTQNLNKIIDHVFTLNKTITALVCETSLSGSVAETWRRHIFSRINDARVSKNNLFGITVSVRSDNEMKLQKMSAQCTCIILKNILINRIETILDNEEEGTHEDIAAQADAILEDQKFLGKLKEKFNIDPKELECLFSNVQSGYSFDLHCTTVPNQKKLSFDEGCIIVSLAVKYSEIPTYITRTLILNGSEEVKNTYNFTSKVLKAIVSGISPGVTFNTVYDTAALLIKKERPELLAHFVRDVGHALNIRFRDNGLVFTPENKLTIIEPRMVFNVYAGFNGLKTKNEKVYAVWLADTIQLVNDKPIPIVLTESVTKELENISYELEDEPPASSVKTEKPTAKQSTFQIKHETTDKEERSSAKRKHGTAISSSVLEEAESIILPTRLRLRNRSGASEQHYEERDRLQRDLRLKKQQEITKRFQAGGAGSHENNKKKGRKMESVNCFNSPVNFPKDLKHNKIYVDQRSESILVPINGTHVPFHVVTLKNVTCNPEEGLKFHTMRINFQVPGSQTLTSKGEDNPLPDLQNRNALFVKELLYRSEDGKHLQAIHRSIKELIKKVKQTETEADVARELAQQAPLQINRTNRRVMLKDLLVRPNIQSSRKVMGSLEAHSNGFRFQVNSRVAHNDHLDIIYANIKHAIFQPCERELIVLIHFHLKSPIIVGKKKTEDVQFFCEVGQQTDDLMDRRNTNVLDPDEMEEELREHEMRRKLNNQFKAFVQQVEEISGLLFDVPYRELMFYGVPLRTNASILPTANCLVHLIEWPPFVLPLEDIEIVSFERIQHGLRNFDMTFVFRDYSKPVRQITSIPVESLDTLKRWLNELEIVWYENKNNLSWSLVMKTIREDVEGFIELGGFEQVLGDGTVKVGKAAEEEEEEDEEESDDADEDYEGSENASGSEGSSADEEESDEESLTDESDCESYKDDSDEEEGLSWDELEERARKEDRKKSYEQDEETSRRSKSKKR